jgi:hypothetical protein
MAKAKSPVSELCRPGTMPATMPEIDRGRFVGGVFVDRTAQIESARVDLFDRTKGGTSDLDLTPGHKRMAGMA